MKDERVFTFTEEEVMNILCDHIEKENNIKIDDYETECIYDFTDHESDEELRILIMIENK